MAAESPGGAESLGSSLDHERRNGRGRKGKGGEGRGKEEKGEKGVEEKDDLRTHWPKARIEKETPNTNKFVAGICENENT